jgi:hypothetical protein
MLYIFQYLGVVFLLNPNFLDFFNRTFEMLQGNFPSGTLANFCQKNRHYSQVLTMIKSIVSKKK